LNSIAIRILLLIPTLFLALHTVAWSDVNPGSGRPEGMANAFVSQYGLEAALHNQAGLATLQSISLSAFFENRFMLKELSSQGIIAGIPTKGGVFSVCVHAFGPAKWRETNLSLAYAKQLTQKLSGGIQLNYFGMKLPEEDQTLSSVGAEVGFIYKFSKMLFAGIHVANPVSIPFQTSDYNDKIPYCIRIGAHSPVTNELTISAEAEKAESEPVIFKAGMEW